MLMKKQHLTARGIPASLRSRTARVSLFRPATSVKARLAFRIASPIAIVRCVIGGLAIVYFCAFGVRVAVRQYYIFLPDYVRWELKRREPSATAATGLSARRTHVFFLFVDHFEPNGDRRLVRECLDRYVALATL